MPPYVKRRTEGVIQRVYTYKLKPDREQEALLSDTAETLRHLWNRALAERLLTLNAVRLVKLADQPDKRAEALSWLLKERGDAFVSQVEAEVLRLSEMSEEARKEAVQRVNLYEQKKRLITEARHTDDEIGRYLARVNVGLCQQTLIRLDRAFQAAWRRAGQGEKPGFPRFKRRGEFDTLQYNNIGNGCFWHLPKLPRSVPYVRLSGIGDIRVIHYRPLPKTAVIRNLSVTHKADGWWVNVSLEVDEIATAPAVRPPLGLCLIPPLAYADSEGHFVEPPQHYNQQLEKIARLQQAGERRQKGSAGKREHYHRLARAHLHIAQQRKQTRLMLVNELLSRCGVLYVEDASISDVLTTPVKVWNEEKKRYEKTGRRDKAEENRAIADLGWADFMQVVRQQAPKFGVCVEVVRLSEEEHDLEPLDRAKIVLAKGLSE